MKLNRVTISGVDDKVSVDQMETLSEKYPFLEWGVLLSSSKNGTPRYPSLNWLLNLANKKSKNLKISGHYCGSLCETLLLDGGKTLLTNGWLNNPPLAEVFSRIQLNNYLGLVQSNTLISNLSSEIKNIDIVLQIINPFSERMANHISVTNVHYLYDQSRGNGIEPNFWPLPASDTNRYIGYAGGIKPSNVEINLIGLTKTLEFQPFWIDMESGVRTDNKLDMKKVKKVLEIARGFVNG